VGRYRRDPLFDYPLPLPRQTAYHDLEIEPEASDEEVKWAKQMRSDRLKREQKALQRKLEAVYEAVEGLREAYAGLEEVERGGAEVDDGELRKRSRRLRKLELLARRVDPEFERDRQQVADLEAQIHRLNSQALDVPEKRREYDRQTPPLSLLRFESSHRLEFLSDPRTALFLLRREVAGFLSARGEEVFHPSDLTREDFRYEFTRNELLDE